MAADHELFEIQQGLVALGRATLASDDWMQKSNLESARSLRALVHEAWMPYRTGVLARFHDGAVSGHTAPAYQVLRTAYEFNDAVIAVSNKMLDQPYREINDAVRKRLGLLMRPVLAGSVQVDLVCPIPGIDEDAELPNESTGQGMMPELTDLESKGAVALHRVLEVLRASTSMSDRSQLSAYSDIIGSDGWRKVARLANRCVEADFTIDFSSRTDPNDWFSFAPAHAAALKTFIKERSLTKVEVEYTGLWQTASSVRSWFDLETDLKQRISGTVPRDLVPASMQLLDQRVRAIIAETTNPDDDQEAPKVKRTLVRLEPMDGGDTPGSDRSKPHMW
ncbi:hypothetical protein CJ179_48125 [Rhodococcus sp. ACS1]|uniref:hypothetical protein n=1 Tax=Rhodococcus sp. ACS1 TaxID=2028570 RepID=UPI000BB100ED|nr:hypothetical protein [Rhodococcus sp. ACS1]PBC35376.1 hypothetical protein CJ179_48125 [Rhodococcus sp. ACS1]